MEIAKAASELKNVITKNEELLKMIYVDIAQPGAKQVGFALENIIKLGNTILLPIKYLNGIAEVNFKYSMEKYQQKMAMYGESKISVVPPEIGVDILDKMKITCSEDIRKLYVSILVSASNKDSYSMVHPKIIRTVNLFTPDEAKIIDLLSREDIYIVQPLLKELVEKGGKTENLGLSKIERANYWEFDLYFSTIDDLFDFRDNRTLYYNNFINEGIVRLDKCDSLVEHENLIKAEEEIVLTLRNQHIKDENYNIQFVYYKIGLTEYGQRLINICTL